MREFDPKTRQLIETATDAQMYALQLGRIGLTPPDKTLDNFRRATRIAADTSKPTLLLLYIPEYAK